MSDVTHKEVLMAVARAYGMDVELVRSHGPSALNQREARTRLQARLVAAYLIDKHTRTRGAAIAAALGMSHTADSLEFVELALTIIEPGAGYDQTLARRMERAEQRIDELHERRVSRRMDQTAHAAA